MCGFYFVYSITDRRSFEELVELRERILQVRGKARLPMVLVGSKSDLEAERSVEQEEGRRLAADFGCPWFEISAKAELAPSPLGPSYGTVSTGRVEEVFCELVRVCQAHGVESVCKARRKRSGKKCAIL